jgi:hypothetical protein
MKKILSLLLVLPAVFLSSAAQAQQTQSQLSYDYLELGYASVKVTTESGAKFTVTGFGGGLSKSFSQNIYGTLTYSSTKKDDWNYGGDVYDIKINQASASLGARMPLSPNTDLFGEVGVLRSTVKFTGAPDESITDYPVTFGVRSAVSESVETLVSANVIDGDWTGKFGLIYKINKQLGVGLFYGVGDDVTSVTGGLRLYF